MYDHLKVNTAIEMIVTVIKKMHDVLSSRTNTSRGLYPNTTTGKNT